MADPKRPTTPRPLLPGSPEVEEGYYDLEEHERNQMHVAMLAHEDAVALWYRALTLYRRAALLNWSISKDDFAELVQSQLLGLGVSSMKAALDMLMAGYYSLAFAVIRHMLESFVQFVYVIYESKAARQWSKPKGGFVLAPNTPRMAVMCETIQAKDEVKGTRLHTLLMKSVIRGSS